MDSSHRARGTFGSPRGRSRSALPGRTGSVLLSEQRDEQDNFGQRAVSFRLSELAERA
jgi:hypothetical protein